MSHRIPVFFLPIEQEQVPENLKDWHSAMNVLDERLERRADYGLRTSTSRNWWYQHALGLICTGLAIEGLGFVDAEIACLDRKELEAAANALDRVLREIRDGIPHLGPEIDEEGSIWWLHYYWDEGRYKEYSTETMRKAFDESEAAHDIDVDADVGYASVVGFYSFLKSLQAALNEALSQDKSLLYVQPQP
jgi:hypothetical protein